MVEEKVLVWGEDLVYLPNKFCPHCGKEFRLDDRVVELSCGDFVIVVHSKCHYEALMEWGC
jgi:ribosomal protein S27AE